MEQRGANVVSVEVTDEHGWDFVPYPVERLEEVFGPRRIVTQQLKNSYWFSHAAMQSKAKVYYGDVYNLPAALGQFDIAVMGSVLLHCRDPLRIEPLLIFGATLCKNSQRCFASLNMTGALERKTIDSAPPV